MSNLKTLSQAIALVLAIAFTLSCSDDGGSGKETIKKARITGVSQKGPFVKGSSAILYELNNDLSQTGRTFQDIIADDWGKFEIKNVELFSPYALLKADGYYRNEVTGEKSASQITLYAITDVTEKDNVNINILTHLEYRRVYKLVEGGMSVRDAKKQAQREILAVFGISGDFANSEDMSIFGTSEGDAALLAISVLLQSDLKEADFSERLSDFSLGFAENGAWNNETEKNKMADWASAADLEGIKGNVLAWGLSSEVPELGKYVSGYTVAFCSEYKSCSIFFDERDGNAYKTVKIGEQTWMAKNLNYDASGSECYANDPINCGKYGRLYDWNAAMVACPEGWHLPSDEEWKELTNYVGVGLKAKVTWNNGSGNSDTYGFSALAGSDGNPDTSYPLGTSAAWWTSTEYTSKKDAGICVIWDIPWQGSNKYIDYFSNPKTDPANGDFFAAHSIRCLKDF